MGFTFRCPHCQRSFELTQDQYMAEEMLSTLQILQGTLEGGRAVDPSSIPVTLTCRHCRRQFTTTPAGRPFMGMAAQESKLASVIKGMFGCLALLLVCGGGGAWIFFQVRWWFWDPSDHQFVGHKYGANSVVFSPDGKLGASRIYEDIRLWDLQTRQEIHRFVVPGSFDADRELEFSKDGRLLVAYDSNGSWPVAFDIKTGERTPNFAGALSSRWKSSPELKASSADGKRYLFRGSTDDHLVHLKDTDQGKILHTLEHRNRVHCLALSPDGRWALTGSDRFVRLWKLPPP